MPPQQLWNEFHGDLEFDYDHEVYWPALMKLCDEKHREQQVRWAKGGKLYGESENYIKGGTALSVGSSTEEKKLVTTEQTLPVAPASVGEAPATSKESVPLTTEEKDNKLDL